MRKLLEKFKTRNQPCAVTLNPSGVTFDVPRNRTLLQAANDHRINFPQHCTVGTCGSCRCKLVAGEVRALRDFSYTLTRAEIDEGYILACQSMLKGDVVIELEDTGPEVTHPATTFSATISRTHLLTHDIMQVDVQLDRPINYTAGQFADIALAGFARARSYSFANPAPSSTGCEVSFHVRQVPGGSYTGWLFAQDRVGEPCKLYGPVGNFWLRPDTAPLLCVAGGSGMAPIKAILEDAARQKIRRPVTYLFGARQQRDLYCTEEMQALREQWPETFRYLPILSEEPEGSGWRGERGLVTDYLTSETVGFELRDCHAYLCGPPGMIDAALAVLERNQVPTGHIHYDKFLDARQLEVSSA